MGAAVSAVRQQIEQMDDAKGKEAECKEALENMRQTAEDQLAAFNDRIRNADHDTHLIPISKILNNFEYVQCTTSKQDSIGPGIKNAVKDFSSGPVAEGLANLASSIIEKLLGGQKGSRTVRQTYAISIDPLGGISRLDTYFFVYNFSSKGLMETANAVVACCIVKSSADITKVDDNTLRVLVNQCFETSDLELRKAIYGELRDALFYSREPAYLKQLADAREKQASALTDWAKPKALLPNGPVAVAA